MGTPFLHYRGNWMGSWYGKILTVFLLVLTLMSIGLMTIWLADRFDLQSEFASFSEDILKTTDSLSSAPLRNEFDPEEPAGPQKSPARPGKEGDGISLANFGRATQSNSPEISENRTTWGWIQFWVLFTGSLGLVVVLPLVLYFVMRAQRVEARMVRRETRAGHQAFLDFGDRWLGIWSKEDEAINGLRGSLKISGKIIPRLEIPSESVFVSDNIVRFHRFFIRLLVAPFYNRLFAPVGDAFVCQKVTKTAQGHDRIGCRLADVTESPVLATESSCPALPDHLDQEIIEASNRCIERRADYFLRNTRTSLSRFAWGTEDFSTLITNVTTEFEPTDLVHTSYFRHGSILQLLSSHIQRQGGLQTQSITETSDSATAGWVDVFRNFVGVVLGQDPTVTNHSLPNLGIANSWASWAFRMFVAAFVVAGLSSLTAIAWENDFLLVDIAHLAIVFVFLWLLQIALALLRNTRKNRETHSARARRLATGSAVLFLVFGVTGLYLTIGVILYSLTEVVLPLHDVFLDSLSEVPVWLLISLSSIAFSGGIFCLLVKRPWRHRSDLFSDLFSLISVGCLLMAHSLIAVVFSPLDQEFYMDSYWETILYPALPFLVLSLVLALPAILQANNGAAKGWMARTIYEAHLFTVVVALIGFGAVFFYLQFIYIPRAELRPSVVFSADGTSVISGYDRLALIWDATAPDKQRIAGTLPGSRGTVGALALSPDGTHIAGAIGDRIYVWNASTMDVRTMLTGHRGDVTALTFAEGGKSLISGSMDRTVRIWNVGRGNLEIILRGSKSPICSVATSLRANVVVVGNEEGSILTWNFATLKPRETLTEHEGSPIKTLQFNREGSLLLTSDESSRLFLWEATKSNISKAATILDGPYDVVRQLPSDLETSLETQPAESLPGLVEAPNPSLPIANPYADLTAGETDTADSPSYPTTYESNPYASYPYYGSSSDTDFPGAELSTNAEADNTNTETFRLADLCFCNGDTTVLVVLANQTNQSVLRSWNTTERTLDEGTELETSVASVAVSPDSTLAALRMSDGALWLYDVEKRIPKANFYKDSSPVFDLHFSPLGDAVIAGRESGYISTWRLPAESSDSSISLSSGWTFLSPLVLSPDANWMLCQSGGYREAGTELRFRSKGHWTTVEKLSGDLYRFSRDSSSLAVADRDKIQIWEFSGSTCNLQQEWNVEGQVLDLQFASANTLSILSEGDTTAIDRSVYESWSRSGDTWKKSNTLIGEFAGEMHMTANGDTLITRRDSGSLKILRDSQGEWLEEVALPEDDSFLSFVRLSSDGTGLAHFFNENSTRIWRQTESGWSQESILHSEESDWYEFSPDFTKAAEHMIDGRIRLWSWSGESWIEKNTLPFDTLTLNFDPEWKSFVIRGGDQTTVELWKEVEGEWNPLSLLTRRNVEVSHTAYSSDGKFLATAYLSGEISITDVQSGDLVLVLE